MKRQNTGKNIIKRKTSKMSKVESNAAEIVVTIIAIIIILIIK